MSFAIDIAQVEFHPTDRLTIDGEPVTFLGNSADGFLFVAIDDTDRLLEITNSDLIEMISSPGRVILEPEYFKKRRKGR